MIHESILRESNPWWENPANIQNDQKLQEWEQSEIRYIPRIMHEIKYNFEPSNTVVYSLRGPRQVGKTTLVKMQIKEFLNNGISAWNILYYSADLLDTPQDVVDITRTYLNISSLWRKGDRYYIFLDEISSVPQWQKGIKWLVDMNILKNATVMVTGSHSIDIMRSSERLPGRRGVVNGSHDKMLLSMRFSEYVTVTNNTIRKIMVKNDMFSISTRRGIFAKLLNNEIDERLYLFEQYQDELDYILQSYLITGGIPKIVDEKIKTGNISESTKNAYFESLMGQWGSFQKNKTFLKQFCMAIIKGMGTHMSWNGLFKEADLGSPNTASDYAHTLKEMFVLLIIHMYGTDKKIPLIKKNRKFYFQDPFFLHMLNTVAGLDTTFNTNIINYTAQEENQGKILEGVVADHLIRWAFDLSGQRQSFDYFDHVFYWKDEKGREVDFILRAGEFAEVPIELKYRNKIKFRELSGLCSFLGKTGTESGIVISKSDMQSRSEYAVLPACIFLLLL